MTNDDGIGAAGLTALADALTKEHDVYVIAPTSQKSAAGHGISVHSPITYTRLSPEKYSLRIAADGTPADCVKLAVLYFMKDGLPDLVISGINQGANIGSDIIYSGTVSAALEGTYLGIPSIAISNVSKKFIEGYTLAAEMLRRNLDKFMSFDMPPFTAFNINYPSQPHKGVKVVRAGINKYTDFFSEVGENSLLIDGEPTTDGMDEDTDVVQVRRGYVTVTPITLDRNNYAMLEKMKGMK